jgi:hypothetical protein
MLSKEHAATIFIVEKKAMQATNGEQIEMYKGKLFQT